MLKFPKPLLSENKHENIYTEKSSFIHTLIDILDKEIVIKV